MRKISIFFIFFVIIAINVFSKDLFMQNEFAIFLEDFIKKVEFKEEQLNKAVWLLETTGSKDASFLVSSLDNEYKFLYSDEDTYKKLLEYQNKGFDPLFQRQLNILINHFKANILPKDLLKEISEKEADLALTYAGFRADIDGKKVTENEIRDILKNETDVNIRKKAWYASKEVGDVLADKIIGVVKLRNKAAKILGYNNYFEMSLDLQEIDKDRLLSTFNELNENTQNSYDQMMSQINEKLAEKFGVAVEDIGAWAWKDPFCQMDPLLSDELKHIFKKQDLLDITKKFYEKMGFDVQDLVKNSDLYEREGKNQHAFCIDLDRKGDVRTLNNVKPNVQWMETLLHEFGHAIYDVKINKELPWLLRSPAHTLTTEAMALFMGRIAYSPEFLEDFFKISNENLFHHLKEGHKRRQLVFSRSAFLITEFEKNMYENPDQDLNKLWWDLVEKYQKIKRPEGREGKNDWAAKYHVGLAPVYYYAYLYGEVFASALHNETSKITGSKKVWDKEVGKYLIEKLFAPGSQYRWDKLVQYATNQPFSIEPWVEECNN